MIKFFRRIKKYFLNFIRNFQFTNFKKHRELYKIERIFYSRIKPIKIDEYMISLQCKESIEEIIEENYTYFENESRKYDDYNIIVIVLADFDLSIGIKVKEKSLASFRLKINSIHYENISQTIQKKLIELFEEYQIESLNSIVIKIF